MHSKNAPATRNTLLTCSALAALAGACGDEEVDAIAPPLVITTSELAGGSEGIDYEVAVTAEGGSAEDYRWSIARGGLPTGVFLRSEGTPGTVLAGRPRSGGTSTFTLRVRDSLGNEATKELSVAVAEAPPTVTITTTMLPTGYVEEPYSATIEAVNGSGFSWRQLSGEIPDGLTLSPSGTPSATLTGTPIEEGRYTFTIRVTDDAGNRAQQQLVLVIEDQRPPLEIAETRLPTAREGIPYSIDFVAQGGTGRDYEWELVSGEFPPGLTMEAMGTPNVRLEGTPTERGSYAFRIQVRDSDRNIHRRSFFLQVEEPPLPLRIVTFELPPARVGEPYDQPIRAVNGSGAGYTWRVSQGALPAGLSIAPGTPEARIQGTPTADGLFDITLEVRDTFGSLDEQTYRLLVGEQILPVTITATGAVNGVLVLPNAEGGQPYRPVLRAVNGTPVPPGTPESEVRYNWVVTGGELPPGLTLNTAGREPDYAGTFSGLPSALGTYTATVTVFDRMNRTDSQVVRISVDLPSTPLVITTTVAPVLASSGCYSEVITASGGGNSAYRWEVVSGTLPLGYTLGASGTPSTTISGIPEVRSGRFPVTIRVTDGFGLTATRQLDLVVDPRKPGRTRWAVYAADADVDDQIDLYVSDICGDSPRDPIRLNRTLAGGNVSTALRASAVSPRGDAVAFIADLDVNDREDVYVVDLRGTPSMASATRILQTSSTIQDALEVKWSPDGSKVAILYDGTVADSEELWVADVSNPSAPSQAVRVSQPGAATTREVYANDYEFSPDGRKIAWVGDNLSSSVDEIFVVDLSGATPSAPQRAHRTFSSSSMDVNGGFVWTPDSRGIVFNADLNVLSRDEMFFTDVSGPGPYQHVTLNGPVQVNGDFFVNFTQGLDEHFEFSPDGSRLFFIGDSVNDQRHDVFVVEYDATTGTFSPPRAITQLGTANTYADSAKWSPDSRRLAVRGGFRSNSIDELFILDATVTTPATSFTPLIQGDTIKEVGFSFADDYAWSPDGRFVAFIGDFDVSSSEEIYLADVSGMPPYAVTKLNDAHTSSAQQINELRFSPDSRKIAFQGDNRSSFEELFVVDLSGPTPSSATQVHGRLSSTALTVYQNTDGFDNAWFWVAPDKIIFRGDIQTSGADRAWFVDVADGVAYSPQQFGTSGQFTSPNQDVFFLYR